MKKDDTCNANNYSEHEEKVIDRAIQFRNQALCIKSNIQALFLIWELEPKFTELKTGCFLKTVQDNCIFRIILETYKLLYDTQKNSMTIYGMANECYKEMIKMENFVGMRNDLRRKKKELSEKIKEHPSIISIIKGRNKIYAHNDKDNHWFKPSYLECFSMTDEIYQSILEVSDVCIDYCNNILKMFEQREIVEYSNFDDLKHLFGLKTEWEEEQEMIDSILGI